MTKINIKGANLDDAITKAMVELGVSSDLVEYRVLTEATNGFLGIGKKLCEIEAWKKSEETNANSVRKEGLRESSAGVYEFNSKKQIHNYENMQMKRNPEEAIKKAKDFLDPIFNTIGIIPEIKTEVDKENNIIKFNLKGENLGVLIGKHGITIDALQHLVALVVNKNEKDKIKIILDSENYRNKREETLIRLAHSVAMKVKKTKIKVELEPMPSSERKIIHASLQKERNIETYSEGDGKYRHVVIKYHR